jgi:NAD(P)H-hydrate epimerase
MEGAGMMSGISALRAGAGKVFWATDNKSLDRPHELIQIEPSIVNLKKVINKNTRLAIVGPGLGMGYEREIEVLWKSNLQLIIDADGLRWLAQTQPKKRSAPWIGTPHEGETVDLLGDIFSDKWSNIINLKKIYGGDWILKGPGTLVSENGKLWLSDYSNGWLGTAGMGDVLAGILAGLWASGSKYPARSSVFLQTQSAKRFLKNNNDAGLTATDISNLVGISLGDLQKASGKAQES